ncbi:hypothetical protein EWM64_g755 [Hericium alpestre]|uniref:Thioredoxin domain-containing protein n=1 Tax=Hericium alpestre TaxID=135208 RepID=A0A4Z0AAH0_9AGAM|nr:hypothetical protein EWM64_g755 [Hericium alpestre]
MRLWPSTYLRRAPYIAWLALAALAVPVESEASNLTPDNFKDTVSEGYWCMSTLSADPAGPAYTHCRALVARFIEHFSPWCGHCRAFAPLWNELVADYEGSSVHLAGVNCAVHGDLCTENGVQGYPQLNLYHDGKLLEQFKGIRDRERITKFITKHTSFTLPSISSAPAASPITSTTAQEAVSTEPEPLADINPNGEVLKLTSATFPTAAAEGTLFVKFFAPWCGHCKKLAPIWTQLAKQLQNKVTVAEVDCEEHKALCKVQGITGFPMLFFYTTGDSKTEYTGSRKLEAMKKWVENAVKPSIQELGSTDLESVVRENPVVYLFMHQPGDSNLLSGLSRAARPLLGSPRIFTTTSTSILSLPPSNSPVLVALKDNVWHLPSSTLHFSAETSQAELSQWLFDNRLPSALELSDGTFQEVMNAPNRPLVVLTAVPAEGSKRDSLIKDIRSIALAWRHRGKTGHERPVVFVWMDADRWSKWLKNMYGLDGSGQVVIADHGKLLYYDTEPSGQKVELRSESIFPALESAFMGKGAKHSENVAERMARYLNAKMISLEAWITTHKMTTAMILILGIIGAFLGVRRLLADDDAAYYNHANGKQGRLD